MRTMRYSASEIFGDVSGASIACDRCANWAHSPSDVLKFLKGEQEACERCPHKKTIETLVRQFQSRHPQWWVVDGVVAIPIWVKDHLRKELFRMG